MGSSTSALKDPSRGSRKRGIATANSLRATDPATQSLSQWKLLRVIGKGAFGKVRVVEDKQGRHYALKYINKETCIQRHSVVSVLRERAILAGLDHPLIVTLFYAFQDTDHLYFISELMLGGDLRYHILRYTFTEDTIRHWIAEMACALAYVHARGIVHRDIKPDNVLLDEAGHVKLADFNISTQIRPGKLPKSRSGSLLYMAPEVHHMISYDGSIDYWSLGVVFYECIYGSRPFHGADGTEVMQKACAGQVSFPETQPAVSGDCVAAIAGLLEVDPRKRLGKYLVARHPFFGSLSRDALDRGESPPIYRPASKSFDVTWELEDLLLEESPLDAPRFVNRREQTHRATSRGASRDSSNEPDMYALLQSHFTDYDRNKAPRRLQVEPLNAAVEVLSPTDTPDLEAAELSGSGFFPMGGADSLGRISVQDEQAQDKLEPKAWRLLGGKKKKRPKVFEPGILLNKPGGRVKVNRAQQAQK
jgi:serine/threonine kinase 32